MNTEKQKKPQKQKVPGQGTIWPLLILIVGLLAILCIHVAVNAKKQQTEAPENTAKPIWQNPADVTPSPEPTPLDYDNPGDVTITVDMFGNEHESENNKMPNSAISASSYDNTVTLSCVLDDRTTLSLGVGGAIDIDGIALHPCIEDAGDPEHTIAYGMYIRESRGALICNGIPQDLSAKDNAGHQVFYMPRKTYDRLLPADFSSNEQPGVCWMNDYSSDGKDKTGATLHIYTVRMSDYELIGVTEVEIIYDEADGCYRMTKCANADLVARGEFTEADRFALAQTAAEFLLQSTGLELSEDELNRVRGGIIWEECGWPLFPRFYDVNMALSPAGQYRPCRFYALHIPSRTHSFHTLYFADSIEAAKADSFGLVEVSNGQSFVLIGRETVLPFTVESFKATLLPGEYKYFNLD